MNWHCCRLNPLQHPAHRDRDGPRIRGPSLLGDELFCRRHRLGAEIVVLASKAAHGSYPKGNWLLVHINDERWPPEALPAVLAQAKAAAAGSPFAATFLVGSSDEKSICELLDGVAALP